MGDEPTVEDDPLLYAFTKVLAVIPMSLDLRGPAALGPIPDADDQMMARLSAFNALAHYRSGLVLAKSWAYGHATAHMVLAIEEYGKAFAYRLYSLGMVSRDPGDRGKRAYIEERVLRCHQCKQRVGYFSVIGRATLPIAGYDDGWYEEVSKDVTMEAVAKDPGLLKKVIPIPTPEAMKKVKDGWEADPKSMQPFIRLLREYAKLDALKLRGLYADRHGTTAHLPQEIGRDEYERVRHMVQEFVGDSLPVIAGEPPPEIAPVIEHLRDVPMPLIVVECPHGHSRARAKKPPKSPTPAEPTGPDRTEGKPRL